MISLFGKNYDSKRREHRVSLKDAPAEIISNLSFTPTTVNGCWIGKFDL